MSKYRFSDLPFDGGIGQEIVVVQPGPTASLDKENFLARGEFESVFAAVMGDNALVHTGTLHCVDGGEPLRFNECGGFLYRDVHPLCSIHPLQNRVYVDLEKDGWPAFHCAGCDTTATPKMTKREFKDLMLHLMIKQMVPSWFACNYTDCSQMSEDYHPRGKEAIRELQALGVISIAPKILWGLSPENASREQSGHCGIMGHHSLGFMVMPGTRSLTHGCDGFDEWLKLLFIKYREHISDWNKAATKSALGPRPAK
ncbi:hypothetical protein KKD19_01525 [Patescibacteria group bacterium]|nr:hypothetical protein [Patescibacteria group bacterium]MBU4511912.1 hypothetical protein [Patescibacteria group bacterium]MCG2692880.1 hypothetical protein [Candidatus Parcubacteria bacterium]